ncbi:hypothetical protein C7C46_18525 [Streptomyces tateyamensis]|uniref:Secreted protein n=1 Tax=Streptomyces tateyamensis TaxID=565073 RepID=A0A2V4NP75_9ACTN|nr:DUF5719 family protein [Streptomyces tateyamensis]PYC77628.1 hypothetical protein C7C46_18525 [Streptomyces tateyamensis]
MKKIPSLSLDRVSAMARSADPGTGGAGGGRTGRSLLACVAVLAVVFGVAELRPPAAASSAATGAPTAAQVERTAAVCPQPMQGLSGTTQLTAFTPGTGGTAPGGTATVRDITPQAFAAPAAPAAPSGSPASGSPAPSGSPAGSAPAQQQVSDARISLAKPGTPVSAQAAATDTAAGTFAVATGAYAPGFTVTQTTTITDQRGMGVSGVTCVPSGTHFWFAGASTSGDRKDYLSLNDAEPTAAVVDVHLYGDKGPIDTGDAGTGIKVDPGTSLSVLLSSLTVQQNSDLAVEVTVRSGRLGVYLHAADGSAGTDWIPASVNPAPTVVLPGLPADLSGARLIVAAPRGDDDADLKIQLSGPNGWFVPAGHESIHVKAGMVAAVDLDQTTHQQISALRLTPSDPSHATPVLATVRINRANGSKSDAAWVTGTAPVGKRASVADARAGGSTTLLLTATGDSAASVRVTASAGSGGGTPATKDVDIPAGSTVSLPAPEPGGGSGNFGLTVETVKGGPVVAARMLALTTKDVPMFTVQTLQDDHSFVQVPPAAPDPGLLVH